MPAGLPAWARERLNEGRCGFAVGREEATTAFELLAPGEYLLVGESELGPFAHPVPVSGPAEVVVELR